MIKSFRAKSLEDCFNKKSSAGIKADLRKRVLIKLESMDAANCLNDLKTPPSNYLHPLHGDREGYYAIRVNAEWRLVFRFEEPNCIYDVMLEHYH